MYILTVVTIASIFILIVVYYPYVRVLDPFLALQTADQTCSISRLSFLL